MVKNDFADGPVAVIGGGGMHDVTDPIRRVEGESWECLRVNARRYIGQDNGSRYQKAAFPLDLVQPPPSNGTLRGQSLDAGYKSRAWCGHKTMAP